MKIKEFAIYRLSVPLSTPYRLSFGPVHAFDTVVVELRDADGNSVWRLSASQTFIQALHERSVVGEFTIDVQIPRAVLPPSGVVATNYTLQGWLTTIGEVPQISATVPVTL